MRITVRKDSLLQVVKHGAGKVCPAASLRYPQTLRIHWIL
jgi:hypothetical protein